MTKYIASLLLLVLYGCGEPFSPDALDPALPGYTTIGINSAGAYINDSPWRTSQSCIALGGCDDELVVAAYRAADGLPDSSVISFQRGGESISFLFPGLLLNSIERIAEWKDRPFTLDGKNAIGYVIASLPNGIQDCLPTSQTGRFLISHAFIDRSTAEPHLVMAGTFGFDYTDDVCDNTSVHYGRFDFLLQEGDIITQSR